MFYINHMNTHHTPSTWVLRSKATKPNQAEKKRIADLAAWLRDNGGASGDLLLPRIGPVVVLKDGTWKRRGVFA